MSAFLVLDLLLVLLVLLHMVIGFWQGPVKQLFVTLGIIFGVLLTDFWARPWGRDLSDYTSLHDDAAAFVIAICFLGGSLLILGYGLSSTLAPEYLSNSTRSVGAAVAALNMMLALSFALQFVRLFLLSDANEESLDDSYVARFLLDELGWVLLFAALVAVPLLLYVLISGRRAYALDDYYDEEYEAAEPYVQPEYRRPAAAAQPNPPRVPSPPREEPRPPYKAEPAPRRRQPVEATRPLHVREPRATAEPAPQSEAERETPFSDTDPHIVIPAVINPQPEASAPAENARPDASEDLAPGYTRCRTCHAVLAPDTTICPNCGTLR